MIGSPPLMAYTDIQGDVRAHAQGIRVYGATLTPFGGNTPYDEFFTAVPPA